jgi:hypothetical protein
MALLSIPLWAVPPNWASPVVESLEWLTGVYASPTGAEQRQVLRLAPRRALEFGVTLSNVNRSFFDAYLDRYGGGEFYLPVWYEAGRLLASEAAGSLRLVISGERKELSRATAVCVQGSTPYDWTVAEVSSGSATGGLTTLTLASPGLAVLAAAGAKVYPAARSRLSEDAVSFSRASDDATVAQVRFDLLTPANWADDPGLDTYDGYPVIAFPFNESQNPGGTVRRLFVESDNNTGIRLRQDTADLAFPGVTGTSSFVGRTRADFARSLLYAMQGRAAQAWFPSPSIDFKLTENVADGEDQLTVQRNGYTDTGGPETGRDQIAMLYRDGTTAYRQITGSTIIDAGNTELLTLDAPYNLGFSKDWVRRISLLMPGRFDQDRFEINHLTDTDGVCEIAAAFRRVPVLRSASDWTPLPFPNSTEV